MILALSRWCWLTMAIKVSRRRSNGVHYQTIGRWCFICGFVLNEAGKDMPLRALESLLRA